MMQKFIHSDIPSSIIENGCSKDSQNISDVSIRHLSSQQVTPEELDAWLRSTDVVLELTAQNDAVVTDSSKRRNEKIYPKVSVDESSSKSRRTRRRKFMNRRRSSLDDPGNRPVFGIEARALLEDNLITNSAADDEKGDHTNDKKNCTPKDELNHSRFGTPVVSNLSNRRQFVRNVGLSSTRLNSDRPRHGSSFDITALSSAYSPSNYHSMKKHDSHSDNSSQDMQPTKKRRVSFPADSDFDENGHVNVDSNFVAEQEPPRMIDRHEQFRRCQSDPEEYASSALHDSSNSIASHHFSRHFSFDSSARSNRISQISSSKFITSLDHSQETSDFIFKFESRRKPNHIVPLANMYSRLEANAKSRKSRKILMRIWKGSGNSAGAPQVSNGNITATDEKGCFRNDYSIGRDESVMMMENYSYPPSSKRIHYHRDSNGDYTCRRVSNESFRELRNGFQSSYCHEGKTQDDFTRIDSNDRYICRENFLASG